MQWPQGDQLVDVEGEMCPSEDQLSLAHHCLPHQDEWNLQQLII